MTTSHLSSELLRLVVDGELPPRALLRMMLEHLLELCPECAESWQEFKQLDPAAARRLGQPAPSRRPADRPGEYDAAFTHAAARLMAHAAHLEAQQPDADPPPHGEQASHEPLPQVAAQAPAAFEPDAFEPATLEPAADPLADAHELLAVTASARRSVFAAEADRFRGRALVEHLLAESFSRVRNSPSESLELAEIAGDALDRTLAGTGFGPAADDRPEWSIALEVRAIAYAANSLRVAGELRAADATLRRARARLARFPLNDSTLHAEVASLEASLRLDQRRFADADSLLDRAAFLYREAGDLLGVAKVRVQQGAVLRQRGNVEQAIDTLREAVRLSAVASKDTSGDRLRRDAVANLALALCDRDDYETARMVLVAHRELFDRAAGDWTLLRRRWLEGRVAAGLGEERRAEEKLSAVRQGFLDRGEGLNAALVSLDLAALYAAAGRAAEVRRLASEMGAVFAARDVGREAVAALAMFQQAVAAERVDREVIRALRRQLQRSRFEASLSDDRQLPS
jgi:tetratricopeptide (TPR) repeat protein